MAKEYIERDVLLDDLRESYQVLKEIYNGLTYDVDKAVCRAELGTFMECIFRVKDFPAADVVEVVRCRDCKYRSPKYDEPDGYYSCELKLLAIDLNGFCDDGERRTNGDKGKKSCRSGENTY